MRRKKVQKLLESQAKKPVHGSQAKIIEQRRRMSAVIARKCKRSFVLVLDVDGTIVNYRNNTQMYQRLTDNPALRPTGVERRLIARPHLSRLLEETSHGFSLVMFTAGTQSHLNHVKKRFGGGYISAGFSNLWMNRSRKDIYPFIKKGRTVTFVDDDSRHFPHQSKDHLIEVKKWDGKDMEDRALLDVLDELRQRYPQRFVSGCKTPPEEPRELTETTEVAAAPPQKRRHK